MLSHAVKKALDKATGLSFSPVVGMSGTLPIASYTLTDQSNEVVGQSLLEVRLFGADFDEIEALREKVNGALCAKTKDPGVRSGDYLLRGKLSGGGILPTGNADDVLFDSTQYITLQWVKKGE